MFFLNSWYNGQSSYITYTATILLRLHLNVALFFTDH